MNHKKTLNILLVTIILLGIITIGVRVGYIQHQKKEAMKIEHQLRKEKRARELALAKKKAKEEAELARKKKQEELEAKRKAEEEALRIAQEAEAARVAEEEKLAAEAAYAQQQAEAAAVETQSYASEAVSYQANGGGLTRSGGVYHGPSGKETWYSQRVLPGGGLDIPGRNVAADGTVRDADGYIVVASDVVGKGSVVETSLGTGKVYDTGVGHNGVDIYTNW